MVEGYANAGSLNGSAGNSAPVGGRRRRGHSAKKLRLVKKSTARNILKKHGVKIRGGGAGSPASGDAVPGSDSVMGGRRKSHRKSHRRSRRGLFGKLF
jgi:hypothetical protein